MSEAVIYLPPYETPAKPRRGTPCNGCGWCCHEEICHIGKVFLKLETDNFVAGPCPFITYQDGIVRCGVVLAERLSGSPPEIERMLGIDTECDSDDPAEVIWAIK